MAGPLIKSTWFFEGRLAVSRQLCHARSDSVATGRAGNLALHHMRWVGARKLRPLARNDMTALARALTETADRRCWRDFWRLVGWCPPSLCFECTQNSRATIKGRPNQYPLRGLSPYRYWVGSGALQIEAIFCRHNHAPSGYVSIDKIMPAPETKTSTVAGRKNGRI